MTSRIPAYASSPFNGKPGRQTVCKPLRIERPPSDQQGINLIELMVGLALSLILMLGLFSIFDASRQTYTAQTGLAQIQERQRFSVALLTGIIQSAGYFPVPDTTSSLGLNADTLTLMNGVFPLLSGSYPAGAAVFGADGAGTTSDTIRVRFKTAGGDNIPNCQGNVNTTAAEHTYDNVFSIIRATNELACAVSIDGAPLNTPIAIIEGVSGLQVLYGEDRTGNGSVTNYSTGGGVSDWTTVRSVKVTLTFPNPNYSASQPLLQPATVTSTQVIQLMGSNL